MTLLVWRQVTRTCSHSEEILGWRPLFKDKRKVVTLCTRGGRQGGQVGFSRATTLGFIYTLDVLLSKLSRSVSVSSNDKALTRRSLLIAYLIVLTDALS